VEHDPVEIWSSQIEVAKTALDKAGLEVKETLYKGWKKAVNRSLKWEEKEE